MAPFQYVMSHDANCHGPSASVAILEIRRETYTHEPELATPNVGRNTHPRHILTVPSRKYKAGFGATRREQVSERLSRQPREHVTAVRQAT